LNLGLIIWEQEFDFDGNAHGPDIAYIVSSRLHLIDNNKRVQRFVPDFAIEVVSSNDTFERVMKKAARYRKCGTREVWVISPNTRQAFVLSEQQQVLLEETGVLETKLVPGFSIGLGELLDRAL
jgi:Uma2 family endonuclease